MTDSFQILGAGSLMAMSATADATNWVFALKELGSIVAIIYLFHYVLTKAIPSMQERYDDALKAVIEMSERAKVEDRKQASQDLQSVLKAILDKKDSG